MDMATTADVRVPAHLWIIGILSLLWNAMGCFDYVMTETGNQAYLSQFPPEMMTYMESLPAWTTATWALGVWGGLIGAILLLMRNRYAVWAFILSLVGMALSFGYMFIGPPMPGSEEAGMMKYMPLLIVVLGLAQFAYARAVERKGLLH